MRWSSWRRKGSCDDREQQAKISLGWTALFVIGVVYWQWTGGWLAGMSPPAQEKHTTIDKGNALACRSKNDIWGALEAVLRGQEAWFNAYTPLLLSGACTELKRGAPVVVLEVTRHPRNVAFKVARVRAVGSSAEHYINAMYIEP